MTKGAHKSEENQKKEAPILLESLRNLPPWQVSDQVSRVSMTPAATAVPITPATFGPIACISR